MRFVEVLLESSWPWKAGERVMIITLVTFGTGANLG